MKLSAAILLAVCPLFGGDIVNVSSWASFFIGGINGTYIEKTCSRTSEGGSQSCESEIPNLLNSGGGAAAATASIGYAYADAAGWRQGLDGGLGSAFARDANEFMFPGTGQIDIIGEYFVSMLCLRTCATLEISQAGQLVPWSYPPAPLTQLPFTIQRGVPFEVALNISAFATGGNGGDSIAQGSLELGGFFDQNGNEVAFIRLPEPSTFWPPAVAIMALLFAGARERKQRGR